MDDGLSEEVQDGGSAGSDAQTYAHTHRLVSMRAGFCGCDGACGCCCCCRGMAGRAPSPPPPPLVGAMKPRRIEGGATNAGGCCGACSSCPCATAATATFSFPLPSSSACRAAAAAAAAGIGGGAGADEASEEEAAGRGRLKGGRKPPALEMVRFIWLGLGRSVCCG